MENTSQIPRVTLNLMRGCLIATIQVDLSGEVLDQFRRDILEKLAASGTKQVILDCSGVEVLDAEDFDALRRTIDMAALMGERTVLAGLQAGVVSALVDLNVDTEGLETALHLDDAFGHFAPAENPAEESGEPDEQEVPVDDSAP